MIEFANSSPWLTFFMVFFALYFPFDTLQRYLRHLDIKEHGWPPVHCDADGDFRDEAES